MSNIQGKKTSKKQSYGTKNDFQVINIGSLKKQVLFSYRSRTPLAIVGGAGIGKTSIINQCCQDLTNKYLEKYECRVMICSQKLPEDFTGIPIPDLEKEVVKFLKLDELPKSGKGILFLDEINQADQTVLRAIFQLLGDRKIGSYELPEGYSMVAAMNPDGENYGTTKPSPALRRRMSWVEVKFDPSSFLEYAKNNSFNPAIVEYLSRNPEKAYNEAALKNDKVFANPAAWEQVSKILESLTLDDSIADVMPICSGLVGFTIFKDFARFYTDFSQHIDPKDIVHNYGRIRSKVQAFSKEGRTDALVSLVNALVFLMLDMNVRSKEISDQISNICTFFVDLPDDTAVYFGRQLDAKFQEIGRMPDRREWNKHLAENDESSEKLQQLLKTTIKISKEVT